MPKIRPKGLLRRKILQIRRIRNQLLAVSDWLLALHKSNFVSEMSSVSSPKGGFALSGGNVRWQIWYVPMANVLLVAKFAGG